MRIASSRMRWGVLQVLQFGAVGLVTGSLLAAPILPRAAYEFSYRDSLPTLENSRPTTKNSSKDGADWKGKLPISDLTEDEAITHALDRLGYGARPGDVERIRKLGLEKWITGNCIRKL